MRRGIRIIAGLAGVATVALAQLGGPISGYVHDTDGKAVRAIRGIAGAASFGDPLAVTGVTAVAAAPGGDFALVVRDDGDAPVVLYRSLRSETPELVPLGGLTAQPDLLKISRDGAAAVAYFDGAKSLVVIQGLPNNPYVATPVDVSILGRIESLAVDQYGRLLFTAERDESRTLYHAVVGSEGQFSPRLLGVYGSRLPLAMNAEGTRGAFADQAANQVFVIDALADSGAIRPIASGSDGVDVPLALDVADGLVTVANGASAGVVVVTLDTGAIQAIPVPITPSCLQPLTPHLFALNPSGKGPVYLFDAKTKTSAFVPAIVPAAAATPTTEGTAQ